MIDLNNKKKMTYYNQINNYVYLKFLTNIIKYKYNNFTLN